jgi:threonine dehydrogenase-like Zn-dependent dehydrogenase
MKAIGVFPAEREVRLIDIAAPPTPGPREVKVKILRVGICGTDREICAFEYGTPPLGSDYLVLGHESFGEVVEVGRDVTRLKVGDLAVPMVRRPCRDASCVACRADRADFCFTGDFTERGIKEQHGFMTEFIVDDEAYMNVVPPALRDVGILTEPLTIAQKALAQVWEVQQRLPWACPVEPGKPPGYCHNAVVLGAGPVGLLGAMTLIAAGFRTVVYSRAPKPNEKASLVESIGAEYFSSETTSVAELAKHIGNIDLVYEAVGASKISFDVIQALGTNGVFCFTGVPGRKAPIEVDTDGMMRNLVLKNQVVFGTVNASRASYESAITDLSAFVKRWPAAVKALITGHVSMEEFREPLLGKADGIKTVMEIA